MGETEGYEGGVLDNQWRWRWWTRGGEMTGGGMGVALSEGYGDGHCGNGVIGEGGLDSGVSGAQCWCDICLGFW